MAGIPRKRLDGAIFMVVTIVIILVLLMLLANVVSQYFNYKTGIASVLSGSESADHSAIIAYSRSWDFAIIKTSSFFMSVLVILIGSLYVLRVADTSFDVSAEAGGVRGAFSTSSPGLAMILLGVVLTAFSLNYKSEIAYKGNPNSTPEIVKKSPPTDVPLTPDIPSGKMTEE